MWGRGPRGNNAAGWALSRLSVTSSTTHKQIGPFWCWFPGGCICVRSRTLWVSPMNCPMRLWVSPATTTSTGSFNHRFWGFISPLWNPGLCGLSHSPVVPLGLSACRCGTAYSTSCLLPRSSSHHLAVSPLCPGHLSLSLLPVWMNVSSLTPWLSDFNTGRFSGSSGWFLFLSLLLSFFWLCKEAKCIYLCLQLGQKFQLQQILTFVSFASRCDLLRLQITELLFSMCPTCKYEVDCILMLSGAIGCSGRVGCCSAPVTHSEQSSVWLFSCCSDVIYVLLSPLLDCEHFKIGSFILFLIFLASCSQCLTLNGWVLAKHSRINEWKMNAWKSYFNYLFYFKF